MSAISARKRGRPPNASRPAVYSADQVIGRTVWQLMSWGFTLRGPNGVAETVALAALELLQRSDHAGLALSSERVEQIFEGWLKAATRRSGWVRAGQRPMLTYGRPWQQTSVRWLRSTRPDKQLTLAQAARRLLQHGGEPWGPNSKYVGDRDLTAKAQAWFDERPVPRLVFPDCPDADKTG